MKLRYYERGKIGGLVEIDLPDVHEIMVEVTADERDGDGLARHVAVNVNTDQVSVFSITAEATTTLGGLDYDELAAEAASEEQN